MHPHPGQALGKPIGWGRVAAPATPSLQGFVMEQETIQMEVRGFGAWIRLNRPGQKNAINMAMLDELNRVLHALQEDEGVRVLVLTGTGDVFCAGVDLKGALPSINDAAPGAKDLLDKCDDVYGFLRNFPKPVIAALNGLTLAGGLELAMCCDLVYAADTAGIGDAHSNFGVVPGAGGAAVLPRKIGLNRAKYLLFSGEFLPAAEMERYGLVNRVVPAGDLTAEVEALVGKLAAKSPLVLRRMKAVANASMDMTQENALRLEMLHMRQHCRSHDLAEGLRAFAEKRKPEFKGY